MAPAVAPLRQIPEEEEEEMEERQPSTKHHFKELVLAVISVFRLRNRLRLNSRRRRWRQQLVDQSNLNKPAARVSVEELVLSWGGHAKASKLTPVPPPEKTVNVQSEDHDDDEGT